MYLVEVRDANFTRVGQIDPAYLSIQWVEIFNGVGQGELTLPAEHPLVDDLRAHGAGIIITSPGGRVFSARVKSAQISQNATDPVGVWTITFEDDAVVVQASSAYANPAEPAVAQTQAYDVRRAAGETVMKQYVRHNIGDLATSARRYPWLVVAPDLARGPQTSGSARFDNMGELLADLGAYAGLGFQCSQVDNKIVFDVYQPIDRSATVRMDIANDALESTDWGYSRPSATRVFAAGQGHGSERTILEITTPESLAAEAQWGLRWEVFKDQRDTDDPRELLQSGIKILSEEGMTVNSLKVIPSDSPNMVYSVDWGLGDLVTIVVDGQETVAVVTQVGISVTSEGTFVIATVGDPVGFDFNSKVVARIKDQDTRISSLERNAESISTFDASAIVSGVINPARLPPYPTLPPRLGEGTPLMPSADLLYESGWYLTIPTSEGNPTGGGYWAISVVNAGSRSIQTARAIAYYEVWTRFRNLPGDGSWSPWKLVSRESTPWTPTVKGGLNVGNGSWSTVHRVVDGMAYVTGNFVFGSTSSVSGGIQLSTPLTPVGPTLPAGRTRIIDASTGAQLEGTILVNNTSSMYWRLIRTDGMYASMSDFNSTAPFVVATGDAVEFSLTYPI